MKEAHLQSLVHDELKNGRSSFMLDEMKKWRSNFVVKDARIWAPPFIKATTVEALLFVSKIQPKKRPARTLDF